MRIVRLSPGDLRRSLVELMDKYGLKHANRVYPSFLHMSEEDAAVLRRNNRRQIRAEMPNATKRKVDYTIGMEWLNYGPNTRYGKVLKPGYILIDADGLKAALEAEAPDMHPSEKVETPVAVGLIQRLLSYGRFGSK